MREVARDQYRWDGRDSTLSAFEAAKSGEAQPVSIDGRIMALRGQGGVIFADVRDMDGEIQVIAEADKTAEFDAWKQLGIGDWVGVSGIATLSKRGEPSVEVLEWARLAEAQVHFPTKKHGLTDKDTIYRNRPLDLAVNVDSMQRFKARSKIISLIRRQLDDDGFLEVETPILQDLYGGAAAKPFVTRHNALDMEMYMRIAPELYLKRLVVGGMKRVYEMGKVFRNEGISTRHNPEFTMIEVYAAGWDYQDQMSLTESIVANASLAVNGTTEISYQGREIDLTPPWKRETLDSMVSAALNGEEIDISLPIDVLRQLAEECGIEPHEDWGQGKLILELYEKMVEKDLWDPIFVTDYPEEVSPLARNHRSRPGYTERFEGIVAGRELCNGYTELNDPDIQYERFKDQVEAAAHDDEAMPMDEDYIFALKHGLPPTAGLGIGIDRLVMLLTDTATIKDVILFPTQKPLPKSQ